jgi:hypothetical protein
MEDDLLVIASLLEFSGAFGWASIGRFKPPQQSGEEESPI